MTNYITFPTALKAQVCLDKVVAVLYWFEVLFVVLKGNNLLHFISDCTTQHALVPQPGIKPKAIAKKAWSVSHWTSKEFLGNLLKSLHNLKMSIIETVFSKECKSIVSRN